LKEFLIFLVVIFYSQKNYAQGNDLQSPKFAVGLQSWYSFTHNGFVQVREDQYQGAHLSFQDDLKMKSWGNVSLYASDQIKKDIFLTFYLSWFYTSGKSTLPYAFYYNGTLIDGSRGLDISPTLYFRSRLDLSHRFQWPEVFEVRSKIGLIYDNMTFYVKGEVAPGSPRNEVYERFGSQALPFPYLGGEIDKRISVKSHLSLSVIGTHIPKFKSFFHEGGRVSIQYSMAETCLNYYYDLKNFQLGIGYKYSYLRHVEESVEDTNHFKISASGIAVSLAYKF